VNLLSVKLVFAVLCVVGGALSFGLNACVALPVILVGILFLMSAVVTSPSEQFVLPKMPRIVGAALFMHRWRPDPHTMLDEDRRVRDRMRRTDERLIRERRKKRDGRADRD